MPNVTPNKESKELHLTRIYDAPVEIVWKAWTELKQVEKWWGPRGWWITNHSKELRPGGFWKYTMHGPAGEIFENKTIYHEVETASRLVYDHGGGEDRPPLFRVDVAFHEKDGKTKMDMVMTFPSAEIAKETKKFIRAVNGDSTWDRLAEFLELEKSGKEKFVITRSFSASIEKVYGLWTEPEQFSKWLPPTGFSQEFLRKDIRLGGRSFYKMTNGKDTTMYGSITYREFSPPRRLVYDQDFRDANDKISRHPFAPVWPESMLSTITLAEERDEDTRVTVEWLPSPKATPEELAAFSKERTGMMIGWTGSFDKLEQLLG